MLIRLTRLCLILVLALWGAGWQSSTSDPVFAGERSTELQAAQPRDLQFAAAPSSKKSKSGKSGKGSSKATQRPKDLPDGLGAWFDPDLRVQLPAGPNVIDVTRPPYSAKGDGKTDDTDAIQRALADMMGRHQVLYFPQGEYLISRTLTWSNKNSAGRDAWGKNYLLGENPLTTTIRLKDQTFRDPQKTESLMWCGGFGSADWFHNYVENLTFDVGDGNPGAIGLQFYSNNTGAVRNCRFIDRSGQAVIGLDLMHRDMNGPLLVKNCEVRGFQVGVSTGRAVNSQIIESLTVTGQSRFGLENQGQPLSVRGLLSQNRVAAIQTYGTFCLVGARLVGEGNAQGQPAIVNYNGGRLYVRDVEASGYARAIGDVSETPDSFSAWRIQGEQKPGSLGPRVVEYQSHPATTAFPVQGAFPRLDIKETPLPEPDPVGNWAHVDKFGADPTGQSDSSAAIQKAIDSGAKTVFLSGFYLLSKPLRIRGKVSRLTGVGGWIDYNRQVQPDLIIEDGAADVVTIEHFDPISGGIEIQSKRTVVLRSVGVGKIVSRQAGDLFLEDVVTDDLVVNPGQHLWGRQLNIENEGTHLTNNGGRVWVLGYKTERGGTLLETRRSGISEILGGFSYTTTAGKLAPMFVTDNADVFAYFAEVCFNGDPFTTLIRETRGRKTVTLGRDEATTWPYRSQSDAKRK